MCVCSVEGINSHILKWNSNSSKTNISFRYVTDLNSLFPYLVEHHGNICSFGKGFFRFISWCNTFTSTIYPAFHKLLFLVGYLWNFILLSLSKQIVFILFVSFLAIDYLNVLSLIGCSQRLTSSLRDYQCHQKTVV